VYVPLVVGVKVHVELVAPDTEAPFRYHWYVIGVVPPLMVAVKVCDWPTSNVTEVGSIVTVSALLTVIPAVFDVACTPALSVTVT